MSLLYLQYIFINRHMPVLNTFLYKNNILNYVLSGQKMNGLYEFLKRR
jgi:hypothetical protein